MKIPSDLISIFTVLSRYYPITKYGGSLCSEPLGIDIFFLRLKFQLYYCTYYD